MVVNQLLDVKTSLIHNNLVQPSTLILNHVFKQVIPVLHLAIIAFIVHIQIVPILIV